MLTQERVKELFNYNSATGIFTRRINIGNTKIGDIPGSPDKDGYIDMCIDRRKYKAHRLAWLYCFGKFPNGVIDHINRIKTDNRIENLRDVTISENCKNLPKPSTNTSGHLGVTWCKGKWQASIHINKKYIHLGRFSNIEKAAKARKAAEQLHGYHPTHGV